MNYEINSHSSDFTQKIGKQIGQNLKGNELIVLVSDLGGGKTTLTKGIASGMGSKDLVSSPSFTISNEYSAENCWIAHYDFYRLSEPGSISNSIAEDAEDDNKVVIVEWPDIIINKLPSSKIIIEIKLLTEDIRNIHIIADSHFSYLTEGLNELFMHKN